jgi:hypothetical protein
VRGGAIPLAVWGALNLALLTINWIWEGTTIHVGETGYAVLVVWLTGTVFLLLNRDSVRKGEPEPVTEPEAVPTSSVAAAVFGLAVGLILFGVVFGNFLVYLGAAVLVLAFARVVRELRWQRRSLGEARERER